jgi:hypothetical protein
MVQICNAVILVIYIPVKSMVNEVAEDAPKAVKKIRNKELKEKVPTK